jgi:membrane fusion protein (multidrug efflux system)
MNAPLTTASTAPAPAVNLRRIVWILGIVIVIGFAIGFLPRWRAHRALLTESVDDGVVTVNVVSPTPTKPDFGAPLPADVQAWVEAPIYARASGYLKNWFVDIGDHVTNGQALAEIVTPELDEQIDQARAEVDQNQAALDLAKVTADRWTVLLKTASVSEQETAEKTGDLTLKKAMVAAARANLKRLQDLKAYDIVTAPFDGSITVRNTDIGQLVTADAGRELFRLAQTDPLRVYVHVPQTIMHAIRRGQNANLSFEELPGRKFKAVVTRIAGGVDATSRTLLVELQVKNPDGEIFAGSYAQVSFNDSAAPSVLRISDNVLITRAQGVQVAVVGADDKVQLRHVDLGRDFGDYIEIVAGLTAADRVVVNPPDAISDGMAVQVAPNADTALAK